MAGEIGNHLGRYDVGGVLGAGATGVVYDALLHGPGGLKRPVALKVFRRGGLQLDREARIGGLLRHPNLVDVYEVGEVEGRWFCAMERCDGSVVRYAPLPPRAVVEVGLSVCAALDYAHRELGLVHLDLKPENLLLAGAQLKVADLGIAQARGFEGDGRVRGTPAYMAPEHRAGGAVDQRADVYALAVTLLHLATGRRPSTSTTLDVEAPGASAAPEDAWPAWLGPLLQTCLSDDPNARPQDMRAMAEALRSLTATGADLRSVVGAVDPGAQPTRHEVQALVGRRSELAAVDLALSTPGVVTLKGPAGIGKTRIARVAERRWAKRTGARTAWVDLSEARSVDGLLAAVGAALQVPLGRGVDEDARQLAHAISGRGHWLLVLDSFEGVRAFSQVVGTWITGEVRVLITSQETTDLPGERIVAVGSLDHRDAVELLVTRARDRGVDLGHDADLDALAQRLDGIPLALELAAGRLGVLSVRDVLDRLGLELLRSAHGGRHGTLSRALAWSWGLLDPPEQAALAQLSVFPGSFTLEAAEDVLVLEGRSALDAVTTLADRSLVQVGADGRLRLLGVVREFAARKLSDPDAEARHGRCFARWSRGWLELDPDDVGEAQATAGPSAEFENLVAACRRAIQRGDGEVASATARAAWRTIVLRGPARLGVELAGGALAIPDLPALDRAHLHRTRSHALWFCGRAEEAYRDALDALDAARSASSRLAEALALGMVALLLEDLDDMVGAQAAHHDAAATFDALGLVNRAATQRSSEPYALLAKGQFAEARDGWERILAVHEARGDRRRAALVLGNLAITHKDLGDLDRAQVCYEAAIRAHTELDNHRSLAVVQQNFGTLFQILGRHEEAQARMEAALVAFREFGYRRYEGLALANLGNLPTLPAERRRALFLDAIAIHDEVGNRPSAATARCNLADLELARGRRDEARALLQAAIAALRAADARAMLGHALGRLSRLTDDPGEANALLDEAEAALRPTGAAQLLTELLATRALARHQQGDHPGALQTLAEAERVLPRGAQAPEVLDEARRLVSGGLP